MVIREHSSDSRKLIVYTPECTVAEGSDGTLIIHNDFRKASSRIIQTSTEAWDYA